VSALWSQNAVQGAPFTASWLHNALGFRALYQLVFFAGMTGLVFALGLYLQIALGFSALAAGSRRRRGPSARRRARSRAGPESAGGSGAR
jgi:hypothetical protein